jgi:AraC-like DNA-binding protein
MISSKLNARIYAWGVRAMYVGPAFNVSAHRTGVAVFCCAIAGSIELVNQPHNLRARTIRCRTALIPAGTLHVANFDTGPIACLYLDPQSADVEHIARGMTGDCGRSAVDHAREAEIITLLTTVERGYVAPDILYQRLAPLLDLAPTAPLDERIACAIARMRATPGEKHSLAALARDVNLSASRLQHLFKACTGVPLRRFRIWNRMGAAIRAVAAGKSLTDAAYHAGFSSAAHFSSAFRAMFGLSPSDLVSAHLEIVDPTPRR